MHETKPARARASMAAAIVVALTFASVGTAVAGPAAADLTSGKVKKIVKKQIAKTAPKLSVKNASTVGGRSVARIRPVATGAENVVIVNDVGESGMVVVSVSYSLAAPSTVQLSGAAELTGDGSTGDEGTCWFRNDGVDRGPNFEAKLDDFGSDNSVTIPVVATVASVPAGAHVAALHCAQSSGTGMVGKDDASIQVTAVPH
jgi:hypothetical protein